MVTKMSNTTEISGQAILKVFVEEKLAEKQIGEEVEITITANSVKKFYSVWIRGYERGRESITSKV